MSKTLSIDLKPSKIYLVLSSLVYLLALFTIWYYFYNFYLSIILSAALLFLAYQFFPKFIFLTKNDSIKKITLDNQQITIEKNNKKTTQYPWFYSAYQSRFLVIINTGKESIVIFKDSIKNQSLSQINRTLNANT